MPRAPVRRAAGSPGDVGRYLEHLVETEGKTLATVRLASIAAVHRLGGHPDPTSRLLVKATKKGLAKGVRETPQAGQGTDQRRPGGGEGHDTQIQRVHQGKRRCKETETQAAMRAAVDLALLGMMRYGLLRRSEASALRWGDVEFHADGSAGCTS